MTGDIVERGDPWRAPRHLLKGRGAKMEGPATTVFTGIIPF